MSPDPQREDSATATVARDRLVWFASAARSASIAAVLRALSAAQPPSAHGPFQVRVLGDVEELARFAPDQALLLIEAEALAQEDVGYVTRFAARNGNAGVVVTGTDPSQRVARVLLASPHVRWLPWPPTVDELLVLVERAAKLHALLEETDSAPLRTYELTPKPRVEGASGASFEQRQPHDARTHTSSSATSSVAAGDARHERLRPKALPADELDAIKDILGGTHVARAQEQEGVALASADQATAHGVALDDRDTATAHASNAHESSLHPAAGVDDPAHDPTRASQAKSHAHEITARARDLTALAQEYAARHPQMSAATGTDDAHTDWLAEPSRAAQQDSRTEHVRGMSRTDAPPRNASSAPSSNASSNVAPSNVAQSNGNVTHASASHANGSNGSVASAHVTHESKSIESKSIESKSIESKSSASTEILRSEAAREHGAVSLQPPRWWREQVADLADAAQRVELTLRAQRGAADAVSVPRELDTEVARLVQFARTLGYVASPPAPGAQTFDLAEMLHLYVAGLANRGGDAPRCQFRATGACFVRSDRALLGQALDALLYVAQVCAKRGELVRAQTRRVERAGKKHVEASIEFPAGKLAGLAPAHVLEPYALRRLLPDLGPNALAAAASIVAGQLGELDLRVSAQGRLEWRMSLPLADDARESLAVGGIAREAT